ENASRTTAFLARVLDVASRPAARRARLGADELAEHASRHLPEAAAAAAGGTRAHLRAGLGAIACTAPTRDRNLERNRTRRPGRRLAEIDLHVRRDVRAAPAP